MIHRLDSEPVPNVTWLLPVKNGMPFLTQTLQSIAAQTYEDWEVLAWDNGSNDGTLEELQGWIPKLLPGKVVWDVPLPLWQSRQSLVEQAGSELLANIDADDLNHPERLERQVEYMGQNPDVAAASCHYNRVAEDGSFLRTEMVPLAFDEIIDRLLRPSPLCNSSAIMRRSMVLSAGGYQARQVAEDYDLWLRLARLNRLGNLDFVGLDYRVRENSAVRSASAAGVLRDCIAQSAAESGAALFGISPNMTLKLFQGRLGMAYPVLVRIARNLGPTPSGLSRIRSLSFLKSCKSLLGPHDLLSKAAIALLRSASR
jgi:glycosyltransferase involved in cell wall biosynthesis